MKNHFLHLKNNPAIHEKIHSLSRKRSMSPSEYIKYMVGIELALNNFRFRLLEIEKDFKSNFLSRKEYLTDKISILLEMEIYSEETKELIDFIKSISTKEAEKMHIKSVKQIA